MFSTYTRFWARWLLIILKLAIYKCVIIIIIIYYAAIARRHFVYLYNGNLYTDKTAYLYWDGNQDTPNYFGMDDGFLCGICFLHIENCFGKIDHLILLYFRNWSVMVSTKRKTNGSKTVYQIVISAQQLEALHLKFYQAQRVFHRVQYWGPVISYIC